MKQKARRVAVQSSRAVKMFRKPASEKVLFRSKLGELKMSGIIGHVGFAKHAFLCAVRS